MSYDLFFGSRSGQASLAREELGAYFDSRPNYQFKETQAWYENEDTGVYFSFDYSDGKDEDDDEQPDSGTTSVAFNMNYFRPHAFGLEAEPEVAAFVKHFDLTVSDPQMSGMGNGEYSAEGFLRGWNEGNQFGYQAMVHQDSNSAVLTLPASRIEALWRWNYRRSVRQDEEVGEEVFVPRIMFLISGGEVRTGVAWGDGIPILLPEVDCLLVPRRDLAPRGWLGGAKEDLVVLTWQEAVPIVKRFPRLDHEISCYKLSYPERPTDVEQLIRSKKPPKSMPTGVSFDQILDRELLKNAKRR